MGMPSILSLIEVISGFFPGTTSGVVWRDWYTHERVAVVQGRAALSAPLGHINVHIRSGTALLLHASPGYTTTETREGPYELLVVLDDAGHAFGTAYIDDGISDPPGPSTIVVITATAEGVDVSAQGGWKVASRLVKITVLGVKGRPKGVTIAKKKVKAWKFDEAVERLVVNDLGVDLNEGMRLGWK